MEKVLSQNVGFAPSSGPNGRIMTLAHAIVVYQSSTVVEAGMSYQPSNAYSGMIYKYKLCLQKKKSDGTWADKEVKYSNTFSGSGTAQRTVKFTDQGSLSGTLRFAIVFIETSSNTRLTFYKADGSTNGTSYKTNSWKKA